jgi:hypothetical protein
MSGIQARQLTKKDKFILEQVKAITVFTDYIEDDEVKNFILAHVENLRLVAVSGRVPQGIIQTHNGIQLY